MFARLFPTNPKQIIEESFLGILKSMILLPIPYCGPDVGEGLSGAYTNLKIRLMYPFDAIQREIYRDRYLRGEFNHQKTSWSWQAALQRFLSDPFYDQLFTIIVAPILEEFIFRGLLIPFISYTLEAVDIDPSYSIILSALAFGLGHRDSMKLSATCGGYLWGSVTVNNNGSLWSSIAGHISLNAINQMIYNNRIKP